jgi:hypothetical protein
MASYASPLTGGGALLTPSACRFTSEKQETIRVQLTTTGGAGGAGALIVQIACDCVRSNFRQAYLCLDQRTCEPHHDGNCNSSKLWSDLSALCCPSPYLDVHGRVQQLEVVQNNSFRKVEVIRIQ